RREPGAFFVEPVDDREIEGGNDLAVVNFLQHTGYGMDCGQHTVGTVVISTHRLGIKVGSGHLIGGSGNHFFESELITDLIDVLGQPSIGEDVTQPGAYGQVVGGSGLPVEPAAVGDANSRHGGKIGEKITG